MGLAVREANLDDFKYIYDLNLQLGFISEKEKVREKLEVLLNKRDNKIFVAEYYDKVIGYIHGGISDRIYDDNLLVVHTLVVDEVNRGKKIGHILLIKIEDWAKESGYSAVGLLSRTDRVRAHKFYEDHGYFNERTQKYYLKLF